MGSRNNNAKDCAYKDKKEKKERRARFPEERTSCNARVARNTLTLFSLLLELSSSVDGRRHVKCVHACMRAWMPCGERERERAARCMYDRYDGTQPIRAVHRACTGVREPLRAIIMAAVDTPSLSPVSNASLERTNERSQLRSLAIIIFSAARKDARAHENRTRPEISVHTRARETRATVSTV